MLYAFFVYNILDFFVAFIYVAVPALSRRCLYSSFVNFYMFKVLPAVASVFVSVLFDDSIALNSLYSFLWKLLFTLQSFNLYNKSIMSTP